MARGWDIPSHKWFRHRLFNNLRIETQLHSRSSAIVFAPHQDDESLGCGGTIILKRMAGSAVTIVFMTDGTTSHSRFVAKDALRDLRNREALRAAERLGVREADVHFLNLPDGRLREWHAAGLEGAAEALVQYRPDEVFVPYRADGTPDHEATNRIVMDAVRQVGRSVRVCEYPVWAWNSWPWVPLRVSLSKETLREVCRATARNFGFTVINEFRTGVFVGDVLERKRAAVSEYRSQMTRLVEGCGWPTLADVSHGRFLECFFQEFEVFLCWDSRPLGSRRSAAQSTSEPAARSGL